MLLSWVSIKLLVGPERDRSCTLCVHSLLLSCDDPKLFMQSSGEHRIQQQGAGAQRRAAGGARVCFALVFSFFLYLVRSVMAKEEHGVITLNTEDKSMK